MIDTLSFILIWSGGLLIGICLSAALGVFVVHLIGIIGDFFQSWSRK
jgi:integral membrane sensor domain MASE1